MPIWTLWSAVAVAVIMLFVCQIWLLTAVNRGSFIDDSKLRLRVSGSQETGMGLEQVATLHLFGDVASVVVAPPPATELPKTDLKLVLVGAITDTDPQKASALIAADNQSKRYFIGDNIPGGAVLHEVLSDSVVLKRESRFETLFFPRSSDVPAGGMVRRSSTNVPSLGASSSDHGNKSLRERLQPGPQAVPNAGRE